MLGALPSTPAVTRAHILGAFDVIVNSDDPREVVVPADAGSRRTPGDYTQLTSYMGNLESSGVPADKMRGILVAPGFSQKVLNSAAIEPRVTLLRFDRVP